MLKKSSRQCPSLGASGKIGRRSDHSHDEPRNFFGNLVLVESAAGACRCREPSGRLWCRGDDWLFPWCCSVLMYSTGAALLELRMDKALIARKLKRTLQAIRPERKG
jgi:hypothetical protein